MITFHNGNSDIKYTMDWKEVISIMKQSDNTILERFSSNDDNVEIDTKLVYNIDD